MNLPKVSHNNISDYFKHEEIVKETLNQISNDFEQFGLEVILPQNLHNVYQELHIQVTKLVEQIASRESAQLYALLYRIDISDNSMVMASMALPNYTHVEVIAHQIIFRDLQKVLTRRYFRQEGFNKGIDSPDMD